MTAAAQCGGDVHVLVAGANAKAAADAAAKIAGVTKVLLADAPYFGDGLAENVAEQALAIANDYSHILAPATPYGKNILPRVAAKLDVAQISEISKVDAPDTFERPIYAATPSPRSSRKTRSRSSPCAGPPLTPLPPKVARLPSRPCRLWPTQAFRSSFRAKWPRATVRN